MSRFTRFLATSDHSLARLARNLRRSVHEFTLPAPRWIARPALLAFVGCRSVYHFLFRVFVCEPLFKAYCTKYGQRLRTDVYIHWVQGSGNMVFGDDVLVDGKCSFTFGSRFDANPSLIVGDRTSIGHQCRFTVGKRIAIGDDCRLAAGVWIFDSNGHSTDPESRLRGLPPNSDEVRPVTVGNNVWLGSGSIIFPGVTVGDGSVVSAGAVVMSDVPPNTVVAGNPARKIASLEPASSAASAHDAGQKGCNTAPPAIARPLAAS